MLSFRINTEDLDLLPDSQMEIEENNPFLQFDGEISGEYSLPLEVPATAKNNRLTNYAAVIQTRVNNAGIDSVCFDSGFQHSLGKLKVENVQHNLNRGSDSRISMYYLTGTSYFWQDIKGKKLRDVPMGGDRTFAWDNYDRNGAGFWGHIHRVVDAAPGTYDYAFYPVLVDGYEWEPACGTDVINHMTNVGGLPTFSKRETFGKDANVIVAFPYVKYVLQKAVSSVGWQLEGDILSDPDFMRTTLINQRAIDWAQFLAHRIAVLGADPTPRSSVTFNLQGHVPDVLIGDLLLAVRNRFGLWYDIDKVNKTVRLRKIGTATSGVIKDLTKQTSPQVKKTILTENKIYGLRNTGTEQSFKLSDFVYDGEVFQNLPAASQDKEGHVVLLIAENNYFQCEQNESSGAWEWTLLGGNTADVEPAGATDYVTGNSTVPQVERYNAYLDMIPRSIGGGYWPGRTEDNSGKDIELCYFYGLRPNKNGEQYPLGAHHIYDSQGTKVGNYSLSLKGKDANGAEVGRYDVAFKPFLDQINTSEEQEVTVYLNRAEFLSLRYSDTLVINGVKLYIKQRKYAVPYKNVLTLTCIRIMN